VRQSGDERKQALRRAAERLLRRRGPERGPQGSGSPWEAQFFGLPRVRQYRDAAPPGKNAALADCVAALLMESWSIERSGVVFCARMTLLSENDDERRLFALIGGEEAAHSAWLEPWIRQRDGARDSFNRFITGLIDSGGAQPLAYLLQVVLEGLGIVHYTSLAAGCRDASLAAVLKRMAQDEAVHHAAGLAAFRAARLSAAERRFLAEGAYGFLQMIRSGPQGVVAALDRHLGFDGNARLVTVFAELNGESATAAKLGHIRRLMSQPGMDWLVELLEQKGAFTPCTAAQCAELYASAR